MTTEQLKEGPVTYTQPSAVVALAESWLLQYFEAFGPKRPGDLEDDLCGEPSLSEMLNDIQGRWRSSPFFPALGRLVDKGLVLWSIDDTGDVWYSRSRGDLAN